MKQRFRIIFSVFVLFAFASSPLAAAEGFADVRPGAWYEFYVYDLVDEGIINGVTETSFVPDGSVTRAQFAKILAAASGDKGDLLLRAIVNQNYKYVFKGRSRVE